MKIGNEDIFTLTEAAAQLGLKYSTLIVQAHKGVLHATKMGNTYLVTAAEIERYRREHKGHHGFSSATHPRHGQHGPGHWPKGKPRREP